tara:strand:+ start:337 stop:1032 length:696 start_codon:yes stop_codon:yes gene_type:complete
MIKEFKINVPSELKAVTLRQYQAWMKILDKYKESGNTDENFLKIKMLQNFCDLSIEDTNKIPLHSFDSVINHINQLFADEIDIHIPTFTLVDSTGVSIEFGMIPKLDDMSFGEYVDLDKYINDVSTWHKAMAVLFRPKTSIVKDKYKIDDYEGSDKFSEYMLDAPIDVVLGAMSFMARLQNQLLKLTQSSSQAQMMEGVEAAFKATSEENMDGFKVFTLWLKKMQLKSMKQ